MSFTRQDRGQFAHEIGSILRRDRAAVTLVTMVMAMTMLTTVSIIDYNRGSTSVFHCANL